MELKLWSLWYWLIGSIFGALLMGKMYSSEFGLLSFISLSVFGLLVIFLDAKKGVSQ